MAFTEDEAVSIDMVLEPEDGSASLIRAAIEYAMNGLHVFPVYDILEGTCGCGDRDCKSPGKHPISAVAPNGFKNATRDVDTVQHWWTRYPHANIGIRTGKESGIIVVDIDGTNGYDRLRNEIGELPETWHSTTGKGQHFFFRHPGGKVPSPTGVIPQVDIRADGAYVVGPPSRHRNGTVYKWVVDHYMPLAECPHALLRLMSKRRRQAHEMQASATVDISEGQRNSALFAFGRRMRRIDATPDAILAALMEQNRALCRPPLDEEITELAHNAYSLPDQADFTEPMALVPFHSCPPSKNWGATGKEFAPITADTLMAEEEEKMNWIFQDYLPVGGAVLLAAKPKTGKTTLVYHLLAALAQGHRFLERDTIPTAVLILAVEEHRRDVKNRLRSLGVLGLENIHLQFGRFDRPNLASVKEYIFQNQIGLVVIDTLAAYWDVKDESDPSQVTAEVMPLVELARETNACVLLIHHCRKAEGKDGDEIRGSGALFACVDIGLVCKGSTVPTHRVLTAMGRYADTPKTLIIDLTKDGYQVKGDTLAAVKQSDYQKVLGAFKGIETVVALADRTGLKRKKVSAAIKHWEAEGKVRLVTEGRPHHPAEYGLLRCD